MDADLQNLSKSGSKLLAALQSQFPDLKVKSGYRDPTRNARAGGAKGSQHLSGNALDISLKGLDDAQKTEVLSYALDNGGNAAGIYPSGNVLHIDTRSTPTAWGPLPNAPYKGTKDVNLYPEWARPRLTQLFGGKPVAKPVQVASNAPLAPVDNNADDDISDMASELGVTIGGKKVAAPENTVQEEDGDVDDIASELGVSVGGEATNAKPKEFNPNLTPDEWDNMTDAEQDAYVDEKHKRNPLTMSQAIENQKNKTGDLRTAPQGSFTGAMQEGMPIVGPLISKAAAATTAGGKALYDTVTSKETSFLDDYDNILNKERMGQELYNKENPKKALAGNLAGGALATGPFAETKLGASMLGLEGPSLGTRLYSGGLGGAVIGGADSLLRTTKLEDLAGGKDVPLWDILSTAGKGAGYGLATGIGAPVLGSAARGVTNVAANKMWPRQGALKGMNSTTIDKLTAGLEGETPITVSTARRQAGPAGMIADLSPGMSGIASGLVQIPGPQKSRVLQAFADRAAQRPERMSQAFDKAMGPKVDLVQTAKDLTTQRSKSVEPLYEDFKSKPIQPTPRMKDELIPTLKKIGAFGKANELATIDRVPINTKFFTSGSNKDYPTTQTWQYVKQAIGGMISEAQRSGNKTKARALIGLKNDMMDEINKSPAGALWAKADNEFATQSGIIDQIEEARDMFLGGRSGQSFDEFKHEVRGLSKGERNMRTQAVRSMLEDGIEKAENGDATVLRQMLAPVNQKKMIELIGKKKAVPLIQSMKQERHLTNQTQRVIPNQNTGASGPERQANLENLKAGQGQEWDLDFQKPFSYIPPSAREAINPKESLPGFGRASKSAKQAESWDQLSKVVTMPARAPMATRLYGELQKEGVRRGKVSKYGRTVDETLTGLVSGPVGLTYRARSQKNKDHKTRGK